MRVRLGLSERQPLVVMKGSGGAAEVVSESLNYFKTKAGFTKSWIHGPLGLKWFIKLIVVLKLLKGRRVSIR